MFSAWPALEGEDGVSGWFSLTRVFNSPHPLFWPGVPQQVWPCSHQHGMELPPGLSGSLAKPVPVLVLGTQLGYGMNESIAMVT